MRVLHVIPSIGPARGGPSHAVRMMASACARAGVTVDVATTNDNERELLDVPLGSPVVENGVRYHYFERDFYPYTVSRSLARWLGRSVASYDVVHIHALFSFSSTAAARAARRIRVPYILRPLGTLAPYGMEQHRLLKRVSWRLVERAMIANAAALHLTSTAERDEALRLAEFTPEVIPLGIDTHACSTVRVATDRLNVLFLARIHPKKQLDVLLRAVAIVPDARLVIAGTGDAGYVAGLKQTAADLGIADRVEWAGHLDGDAKTRAFAEAGVFALPSINENFGIAVVEALASGLPVIVSRGVAIHKEVEAAGAGIVADDVQAVATALTVFEDPAERERMGRQARLLAERAFSADAMASGLIGMYERAVRTS
jgi:glycosyltransferase involved in cell wall biosynthesis